MAGGGGEHGKVSRALFAGGLECETKEFGHSHQLGDCRRLQNSMWSWDPGAQPQWTPRLGFMPNPVSVSLEYAENIGDGRSPEFRENEQKRILGLLESF